MQALDYTLIGLNLDTLQSIQGGMPEALSLQQQSELQVKLGSDDMLTIVHHPKKPNSSVKCSKNTSGYPLHFIEGKSGVKTFQ